MKKDFTVKEFVKKYKACGNDSSRAICLKDIKYKKYIPMSEKMTKANSIIISTFENNGRFLSNSVARYIFTTLYSIDLYTNLEIDMANPLDEYDALAECGLLTSIISNENIQKDFNEFSVVIKMYEDDYITNKYEIHSYIENIINDIGQYLPSLLPLIDKMKETE